MKPNDLWTAAFFACALAAGSVVTWESGSARFEGRLAIAAARHPALGGRPEASAAIVAAAPDPAPPSAATASRAGVARDPVAHTAKAPAQPSIVIELPDVPEPVVGPPPTLDDLFPPLPKATGGRPCFDRLQGVKGISPCPDSTPRESL